MPKRGVVKNESVQELPNFIVRGGKLDFFRKRRTQFGLAGIFTPRNDIAVAEQSAQEPDLQRLLLRILLVSFTASRTTASASVIVPSTVSASLASGGDNLRPPS